MKIAIPKTIKDCSPKQLAKWLLLTSEGVELDSLMDKLEFRVEVVSIFSGESKDQLRLASYKDINMIFARCIELLATYEQKEPSQVIEIEGQRFEFDKNIFNFSTGQAIDMKLIPDVYQNPTEVLSIIYVEEGMVYNELDDRGRVKNPAQKRTALFDKEFDGDEFLNVFAFFLRSYKDLNRAIYILKMAQTEIQMEETIKDLQQEVQTMNGTTGQQTS